MKLTFVLCVLCLGGLTLRGATPATKENLRFDGRLWLESSVTGGIDRTSVFFTGGEQADTWTRLVSIREYPLRDKVEEVADSLINEIKKQDPNARISSMANPASEAVIVTVISTAPKGVSAQLDVFKLGKREQHGVLVQQYAQRDQKTPVKFLKNLPIEAKRIVGELVKGDFEIVK